MPNERACHQWAQLGSIATNLSHCRSEIEKSTAAIVGTAENSRQFEIAALVAGMAACAGIHEQWLHLGYKHAVSGRVEVGWRRQLFRNCIRARRGHGFLSGRRG